jgi:hypothetical protein
MSRKFFIWLVSLSIVVLLYLFYVYLTKTTEVDIKPPETNSPAISQPNDTIGTIGDVGVGTVDTAEFTVLKNNRIERKWGFRKLLHQEGDEWKLEQPFIRLYRQDFQCNITADTGTIEVETALGKPSPRDATLEGNVVVNIIPTEGSDVPETKIFLDNIIYISDRSLLSTAGDVEMVSEQARLTGTGLELIYNEQNQKLKYMRIRELDKLTIDMPNPESGDSGSYAESPPKESETETADVSTDTGGEQKQQPVSSETNMQATDTQDSYTYKCIFSENVEVCSPERDVFTELLEIVNIQSQSSSSQQQEQTGNPESADGKESGTPDTEQADTPQQPEQQDPSQQDDKSDKYQQVEVTCDGGIVLVPSDSSREVTPKYSQEDINGWDGYSKFEQIDPNRTTFLAHSIEYDSENSDITADCKTKLYLYPDSVMLGESEEKEPVKIIAQEQTRYLAESGQVTFEGNCVCTMARPDLGADREYSLTTPRLRIELPGQNNSEFAGFAEGNSQLKFYASPFISDTSDSDGDKLLPVTVTAADKISFLSALDTVLFEGDAVCKMTSPTAEGETEHSLSGPRIIVKLNDSGDDESDSRLAAIKHVTADKGTVRLSKVNNRDGEFYNGVELKCRQFDYDSADNLVTALGPGSIALDNTRLPEPEESRRFDLQKPCYAVVRDFEELVYDFDQNRITAESQSEGSVLIDYFPVSNGEYKSQTSVSAGLINAFLKETVDGGNELVRVTAENGVTYDDKSLQFAGSKMLYQADESLITATGGDSRPCLMNGTIVEGVKYNTKTGKFKAEKIRGGLLK